MLIQNFVAQSEPQLHEKHIERHRISWSVQTHAVTDTSRTHSPTHIQTTAQDSAETLSTRRQKAVGYKNSFYIGPCDFFHSDRLKYML